MTFTARIRRNSAVWNRWHGQNRTGGSIDGVAFRLSGGGYSSGELSADEVVRLRQYDFVEIEMMAVPVPLADAAEDEELARPSEDDESDDRVSRPVITEDGRYPSVVEAARSLGVSPKTVRNRIKAGRWSYG